MYLNTHTYYSLRYGTISPKELIGIALQNKVTTLCLTEINSTSSSLEFVQLCLKNSIKPVLGVDFRNGVQQQFIMIAINNKGLERIHNYLSDFLHIQNYSIPKRAIYFPDTYVIYPFTTTIDKLRENEFIGIKPSDLNHLKFSKWRLQQDKLVILKTVSFQHKKGFNTHRLLRAIDNNTLLSKLPISEQGNETDLMVCEDILQEIYAEYPQIITNTTALLKRCSILFDFLGSSPKNQKTYSNSEVLDFKLLKKLAYKGLHYRYKKIGKRVFSRLEKELSIIKEKQFVSYFLINWKILKYARSKGYYYVGRGSGANSIVAYLLRITDVDPIELDLYFERFINLYRTNPPDFDLDFSWRDRDDIMNYIFKTFKNTSLIAVYNTFKYRASVRELGKVFGLPKEEIDKLTTNNFNHNQLDHLSKLVLIYSKYIKGFPNYLGIHPGGILISEKPIHYYTATYLPPKGFSTAMFDMVVAENIGLYKFDILSQRGLGKIREAVDIVKYNHPKDFPIDIHDIKRFKEDEKIKHLLRNAEAIGCFYVESPAMRMLLKKLQVDNYLGLVAASSVIRPGVSKSGMMREYIKRYRKPERRKDAHPVLLEIMPETYGVMVYQEDVIKVAHYFGGLTLGEADMLRRGMSGKFRSKEEFLKVKKQFFDNCNEKGHSLELTSEIWRQIESFAGYAFAKGHSASYAVESYQSLYLKAYYPLEYMVATLNNFGGFYQPEYYVHEARMNGAIIHPPHINKAQYQNYIEGKNIYLGFIMLHSFELKNAQKIVTERTKNGLFLDLDDFIDRVAISLEQIAILIKVNAFQFTQRNKRELLWEAHMKVHKVVLEETISTLFKSEKITYQTPQLTSSTLEDAFDELQYIGFTLDSPFKLLREPLKQQLFANDLPNYIGKVVTVYGYYVTAKRTITSKGEMMYFGTFIDTKGKHIDTVHFPPSVKKYPLKGRGVYKLIGKVTEEFDCVTIEIEQLEKLAIIQDPRYVDTIKKVSV
ncbi:MAG: DNA polymerase III subunit alpha [Lutibacter sp.]|uniref:DNA polymerase III subunit alpha n=1 Tax=Lutibacter sp. TaxID=1925666 RepID=UPI0017FA9402|nr:DNA polymerase III subunit alpha [Lutibacter sp.]MBT8315989.1 DNA polymerase III subunit alpha [Lutibacter sp.]NNJ56849.1 DNA polymerase III subunit alpha [Lutibacter sp.]